MVGELSEGAFREHHATIYRYLLRRTGNAQQSEDLTQDVFASLASELPTLEPDRPVLGWLYTVARNRLIDESRKGGHSAPGLTPLHTAPDLPATELKYGGEVARALRRASLRMTAADRTLLGLRLIRGLRFKDIATELSITESAAKMRYLRSLRVLRAALEDEGVSPPGVDK